MEFRCPVFMCGTQFLCLCQLHIFDSLDCIWYFYESVKISLQCKAEGTVALVSICGTHSLWLSQLYFSVFLSIVFLGFCQLYIFRFVKKCLLGKEGGWGREEPRWFLSPSVGRSCGKLGATRHLTHTSNCLPATRCYLVRKD